jgi:hypothetical protein
MPRPRDGVDAQFRPAAIAGAIDASRRIAVGAAMAIDGTAHDAGRFLSEQARSLRGGVESPFLQMMRLAAGIGSLINLGRGDPDLPTPPHDYIVSERGGEPLSGWDHRWHIVG